MFTDQLSNLLEYCNTTKGHLLLVGDFNIHCDSFSNPSVSKVLDTINTFTLHQYVTEPTHQQGHIIDRVFSGQDEFVLQRAVVDHTDV